MLRNHILNTREVKRIKGQLSDQFGFIGELPYVFFKNNKDKLFIIHRDMEQALLERLRIDAIGLYFGTLDPSGIRLSLEGSQIIGPHSEKNIVQLDESQYEAYITGKDVEMPKEHESGVYIVQHHDDFAGCCKISAKKLTPFVPKSRRLKTLNA